jgi:hypothetical protein
MKHTLTQIVKDTVAKMSHVCNGIIDGKFKEI